MFKYVLSKTKYFALTQSSVGIKLYLYLFIYRVYLYVYQYSLDQEILIAGVLSQPNCSPRADVVRLDFQAGSTFPVPVCTVPSSMHRASRCNKVDAVRLYASYMLNLLLLKGQSCA